jgi:hypothetical protein
MDDLIDNIYEKLEQQHVEINYIVITRIIESKNEVINEINSLIMDQFPSDYHTYLSANSIGEVKHEPLYQREILIL